MGIEMSPSEQKLFSIIKHAPLGVIEIDESGAIKSINIKGEELLAPIVQRYELKADNLFPIFSYIDDSVPKRIQDFSLETGIIVHNETCRFLMPSTDADVKVFFNVMANKMGPSCIMVSFDDVTEKVLKEEVERTALLNKAVDEGKYEIASGVLHDIGNAIVGFGSYLSRIRRAVEQGKPENVKNLSRFFEQNMPALEAAVGEAKSKAVVDMLTGIADIQTTQNDEINKALTEQHNIVAHIQEILNIHRQYLTGRDTKERKPVNLRSIITDCLAMLMASAEKKGIIISLNIPTEQPVIKGDRTKLMQVILNILKNSIESIDHTAIEKNISIDLHTGSDKLLLEIRDSGSGFDEENGKQLFTRGFTTKSTGTGLGLYNCRTIVESHSGTIDVVSAGPGKGATTTIEFQINNN